MFLFIVFAFLVLSSMSSRDLLSLPSDETDIDEHLRQDGENGVIDLSCRSVAL